MFRGNIQVYLESVFNNEIVAWYISYLDLGPGIRENYPIMYTALRINGTSSLFAITRNFEVKSRHDKNSISVAG